MLGTGYSILDAPRSKLGRMLYCLRTTMGEVPVGFRFLTLARRIPDLGRIQSAFATLRPRVSKEAGKNEAIVSHENLQHGSRSVSDTASTQRTCFGMSISDSCDKTTRAGEVVRSAPRRKSTGTTVPREDTFSDRSQGYRATPTDLTSEVSKAKRGDTQVGTYEGRVADKNRPASKARVKPIFGAIIFGTRLTWVERFWSPPHLTLVVPKVDSSNGIRDRTQSGIAAPSRRFKRFCVAEDRSVRADLVPAELPDSCRAIR